MKTLDEIYQEMLACFGTQTGMELTRSCDLSVRLYALAAQVYALFTQADWVRRQAFPQTAQGEYLDYHAMMRGLERKQGTKAAGTVRFFAGETAGVDRTVPKGTVCMTAGLIRFETTAQAELPAGSLWADVPVQALEAGSAGNAAAGSITVMAVAPVGISSCTNLTPCSGGADEEGDELLRERILNAYSRLPNGSNAAFYRQEAMSFDQVAAAAVQPRPRGVGTVDVVVASQAGVPEQALLDELAAWFQERREIAVDVQVRAPRTVKVDLSVQIAPKAGVEFGSAAAEVEEALRAQFTGKLLGQDILRVWLGNQIYGCESVANYVLAAPAADLLVDEDVLPVLGTLTVEAMA